VRRPRLTLLAAGVLALAGLVAGPAGGVHAVALHRAAVIVETGGDVHRTVVTFSDDSISGVDALQRVGADPIVRGYAGQGGAVCMLYGVGHPADSTCLGTGSDPRYWAYWRAPAGSSSFSYSSVAGSTARVHDGDVEGWRFGSGAAPQYFSVDELAGPPPAPPTVPADATVGGSTPAAGHAPPVTAATGSATPSTSAPGPGAATPIVGGPGNGSTQIQVRVLGRQVARGRRSKPAGEGLGPTGSPAQLAGFGGVLAALGGGIVAARRARTRRAARG